MTDRVTVGLGGRAYEVMIGDQASEGLADEISRIGAKRAVVVTQKGIGHEVDAGIPQHCVAIGSGEEAKTLATVEFLCREFAKAGLTRSDVVVALGGGVVTDTAGFAAASYHRGTPVIHVPTTLLAQVDAAIGGKTGVNLPEGKNLVGAFWQPAAVLCDTALLATLPNREWRSGLGEVVKCELLGAPVRETSSAQEMVAACVRLKADIVTADERETSGRRDLLNYGHTLGHALETVGAYDLRHGEAVAIGLVFAARLAHRLGRISGDRVEEFTARVSAYGLPTIPPPGLDPQAIMSAMQRDKKAQRGLRLVLDGANGVESVDVEPEPVLTTLGAFLASPA
jgi:5-deoxy-5-amino-3-dehydroquinate synthase